ncbi:MAG: hypothetical protein C4562_07030 [Actinobacteria bacterium]|nr:MAG: hypothetical protein C4562_07030 [Actinomycetota bacterium]
MKKLIVILLSFSIVCLSTNMAFADPSYYNLSAHAAKSKTGVSIHIAKMAKYAKSANYNYRILRKSWGARDYKLFRTQVYMLLQHAGKRHINKSSLSHKVRYYSNLINSGRYFSIAKTKAIQAKRLVLHRRLPSRSLLVSCHRNAAASARTSRARTLASRIGAKINSAIRILNSNSATTTKIIKLTPIMLTLLLVMAALAFA